jgi:hypothetical protein
VGAILTALVFGVVLALAGCGGDADEEARGETRTVEATGDRRTVKLSERHGSRQSGTATLTSVGESTNVVIVLSNPRRGRIPAHIHTGTCEDRGEIEYELADVVGGTSETTVEASLDFLLGATDAAFAVDVHESATELDTYVACGTLSSGLPPPP